MELCMATRLHISGTSNFNNAVFINRNLFSQHSNYTILKKNLRENVDYLFFSKQIFDKLKGWFGIDHEICRKLRMVEGELELDLSKEITNEDEINKIFNKSMDLNELRKKKLN